MNRELLENVIRDKGIKKSFIAKSIGISNAAFTGRLTGLTDWKVGEVAKVATVLGLSKRDRDRIFFD